MKKRLKIILIVLLLTLLLIVIIAYFVKQYPKYKSIDSIPQELINSEKEAIDFAKNDEQMSDYLKNKLVDISAWFDENGRTWTVMSCVKGYNDYCYGLTFTPKGDIIHRQTEFA